MNIKRKEVTNRSLSKKTKVAKFSCFKPIWMNIERSGLVVLYGIVWGFDNYPFLDRKDTFYGKKQDIVKKPIVHKNLINFDINPTSLSPTENSLDCNKVKDRM